MGKTTSPNKRVTIMNESSAPDDEEDEFQEHPSAPPVPVSASALESSAPSSPVVAGRGKRRKTGEGAIAVASLDVLCDDVVTHIYSLLGSVRDVHSFALCSRRILNILTPRIVIRSAVFQRGHAAKSIKEIVKAVERRSIFVPDPPRLLRLVNGTRCERLAECSSYDLRTGLSGKASVVRPGIGMFLCRRCGISVTTVIRRRSWAWISGEERVATTNFSRNYNFSRNGHRAVVNECAVEAVTRNPCGPVVSLLDVGKIESTHRDEGERRGGLRCLLEQRDGIDEHAQRGGSFMEIFQEAERDLRDCHIRRSKAWFLKDRERDARRLTRMRAVFEQLDFLLADAPWKQLALSCCWRDQIDDYPHVSFDCEIVQQATERLFAEPSSCSQTKLENAAEDITRAFNLLYEKDIFSFAFLAASPDAFEQGLYQYCEEHITPEMLLVRVPCNVQAWLDKVRKDNMYAAVIDTFQKDSVAFEEAFATAVVSSKSIDRLGMDVNKFRAVACNIWRRKYSDNRLTIHLLSNELFIRNHLNQCRDQYAESETSLVDFLSSPLTTKFLEGGEDNDRNLGPGAEFTRQNAVDHVFNKSECIVLLQTHNFGQLLQIVEGYYQRPFANIEELIMC